MEFLPLSRPSLSADEIADVVAVLQSGWITTGTKAAELEQRFCDVTGCQHAVALSSATAGMHLLLHALDIGPGDEVITPSMTWVSTINMIVMRGATPVFVDVDRGTLMTNAAMIEPLITTRTKLIVPVHFAGAALDLAPLRELASRYQIVMAEDAAHATGTYYQQQAIGHQGTAIFSFHPIKNITTGEGGMFCSDDAALAERIRRLKFHGLGVDAFDRETQGRSPQAEVQEPGFKYNLPDMNAVLGLGQLARLSTLNQRRAELAALYHELLADISEVMPLQIPDYAMQHAWHLYIIRLDVDAARISRDDFISQLKLKGIGASLHFRAVHTQKYYREQFPTLPGTLSHTEWNSERLCSLPLFPDMRDSDVHRVVDAIKSILSGRTAYEKARKHAVAITSDSGI